MEKVLGAPVYMSFPNDYIGVHKALTSGKNVSPNSELGIGFAALARLIRNGGERTAVPPKAGFRNFLRSRKKPAQAPNEPGLLAS